MNCHEVQSLIAQMGGSPAPEIVAHTRGCAACRQALSQQEWFEERFAEVSAHLLAHAPPFSGNFREYPERSASRATLSPLVWAAALLVAAFIAWWTWTSSPKGTSKPFIAERPAPSESADGADSRESSDPAAPLSDLDSIGPVPGSSSLADTRPIPAWPEERVTSQPSTEPAGPEPSPEIAASEPLSPANSPLGTGVFKMQPTSFAPNANGYLAAIIPNDALDQAPGLVALSLSGLPSESDFYVRTSDVGGNQVWLGSGRTDIRGSAVVVMLRGSPTIAGEPLTVPATDTEPPVTLNFEGASGQGLVVVDSAGNVLLTVDPSPKPADRN